MRVSADRTSRPSSSDVLATSPRAWDPSATSLNRIWRALPVENPLPRGAAMLAPSFSLCVSLGLGVRSFLLFLGRLRVLGVLVDQPHPYGLVEVVGHALFADLAAAPQPDAGALLHRRG